MTTPIFNGVPEPGSVQRVVGLCLCGCGAAVGLDTRGRQKQWIRGHQGRGKKHSAERLAKMSAAMKRAWADPARLALQAGRNPPKERVEKTASKLRGVKKSAEHCAAISRGLTGKPMLPSTKEALRLSRVGRPLTPLQVETLRRNRRPGSSAEEMKRYAAMRDLEKLKRTNSVGQKKRMAEWKASGRLDEIRLKAGTLKGLPYHIAAKAWVLRDPVGRVYRLTNLREWARRNQHLFEDDRPESRTPFSVRIAGGLSEMFTKAKSCSYRGWVAVSNRELLVGAPDLLTRAARPNDDDDDPSSPTRPGEASP